MNPATRPGERTPPPEESEHVKEDERLDEELEETFPASDPIPVRHDSK